MGMTAPVASDRENREQETVVERQELAAKEYRSP